MSKQKHRKDFLIFGLKTKTKNKSKKQNKKKYQLSKNYFYKK